MRMEVTECLSALSRLFSIDLPTCYPQVRKCITCPSLASKYTGETHIPTHTPTIACLCEDILAKVQVKNVQIYEWFVFH